MKTNKLILIGAGPGDKELITLKGVNALKKAKVVLYDALVNEEILNYIDPLAVKVYVGKRAGEPSFEQDKINQLIVSYALIYGEVIRLKGGDPFIFGRGFEEVSFAKKNGLLTEVIPGISSATGLTAINNISLTQRGVAYGFWVVTASKEGNEFNQDIELAAKSNSTIVILMGINKLSQIITVFKNNEQYNLPIMIIQNGSMKNEKTVLANISTIEKIALKNKIASPAIIVIGKVLDQKIEREIIQNKLTFLN